MRLIDADRLNKPIYAEEDNITGYGMSYDEICGYNDGIDIAWNKIDQAPTIDAVPVVRCRECKFGTHFGDMEDEWIRCMNLHGNPLMPFDGFCSYGERKEGAE